MSHFGIRAEILGHNGVPADRVALPEELFNDMQAEAMKVLLPYPNKIHIKSPSQALFFPVT